MKNISKYILGLFVIGSVYSCKKDLDINTNPNTATKASVNTVLPTSIVSTAANVVLFSTGNAGSASGVAGGQAVGFYANGGGVSGWGSIISYNYVSSDGQTLWSTTYNTLTDIKYVIDNSDGNASLNEFNAAAKVLKAYNFQLLVDVYNDVPYTEANNGTKNLQPKYDKATDIYKSLADLCDDAIAKFKAVTAASAAFKTADPLFGGDPKLWAAFAQTLKLKLVLKGGTKVAFTNKNFDTAVGFITNDAIVQPVYAKLDGKQNPMWNAWAYTFSGAAVSAGSQYAPTPYILAFYTGEKVTDAARKAVVYNAATPIVNQLGYQGADAGRGAAPNSWFKGTNSTTYSKIGIFKGPDAGQPIMLAAESYFLQAEANVTGLLTTGSALANFESGVVASFAYLYKDNTGANTAGKSATTDFAAYKTANSNSKLVNFSLATTNEDKLEAIITQKYLAFNPLFGHEAWNEFKRTGYPSIVVGSTNKIETFVSIVSEATAANKLPTRILYPLSEFNYNASNVPTVDKYSTKIFWAK